MWQQSNNHFERDCISFWLSPAPGRDHQLVVVPRSRRPQLFWSSRPLYKVTASASRPEVDMRVAGPLQTELGLFDPPVVNINASEYRPWSKHASGLQ
jgi:hypothetical protein